MQWELLTRIRSKMGTDILNVALNLSFPPTNTHSCLLGMFTRSVFVHFHFIFYCLFYNFSFIDVLHWFEWSPTPFIDAYSFVIAEFVPGLYHSFKALTVQMIRVMGQRKAIFKEILKTHPLFIHFYFPINSKETHAVFGCL